MLSCTLAPSARQGYQDDLTFAPSNRICLARLANWPGENRNHLLSAMIHAVDPSAKQAPGKGRRQTTQSVPKCHDLWDNIFGKFMNHCSRSSIGRRVPISVENEASTLFGRLGGTSGTVMSASVARARGGGCHPSATGTIEHGAFYDSCLLFAGEIK